MLVSALASDERQKSLLMSLKQSIENESSKNSIDNKIKGIIDNKEIINLKTNDKVHSNDIIMNKTNYNAEIRRPKRKELWYVNLGQRQGSLQYGVRPCLVDSNDVNNKYSNIINVYPLTSQMTKSKIPVHIEIEGYGLKEKSIILIEQGLPIDIRYQLLSYIGTVDDLITKKVDIARNIQHGDLQPKNTLERLNEEVRQYIVNKIRFIKRANDTIEFLKTIKGDNFSINLAEDEVFREENALQSYCQYKNIDYKEICKNYDELFSEKYESIAL